MKTRLYPMDRGDILEAYYWALTHCHGGQASREYARLCRVQRYFHPGVNQNEPDPETPAADLYEALCEELMAKEQNK